ncbi:MAG: hypothetical protein JRL30_25655 [Deltaproteobacteria bacterium]|nr:hypothetical protein [Deltaproteobacteria bacterium]
MNKDLYFLPLISEALQKPDARKALRDAFEQIERLGQRPEYKRGFRQFNIFMTQIKRNMDARISPPEDMVINALIRDLQLQIIAGVLEGNPDEEQACMALVKSRTDWGKELERLRSEAEKAQAPERTTKMFIDKDGKRLDSVLLGQRPLPKTIRNIKPGRYEFRLETGRVLIQKKLTKDELLWVYAYPAQDLKLAADTGKIKEQPTTQIELLRGELIIRVFPGLESGRLQLTIRGHNDAWP